MEYTPIRVLDDVVARQIAAGEVIDRPSSIVRELVDNCIDAEAQHLDLFVKEAGLGIIQLADNGVGMKKLDLATSCLPHATSKISLSEDLQDIHSMGFRGEALPSIAAVSRLQICSKHADEAHAWQLEAYRNVVEDLELVSRDTGTTVVVTRLFGDMPARRKFLSTPQAELAHLKNILLKKLAAFPDISCSMKHEQGTMELVRESALMRAIRICSVQSSAEDFLYIEGESIARDDLVYGMSACLGLPHIGQKTRKHIHLYVNNRPIKDFSILQAVEYAYRNVLHAKYPQAVVFLSIPPSQLDVNVHPAKTEVKIRGMDMVRRLIISSIEKHLDKFAIQVPSIQNNGLYGAREGTGEGFETLFGDNSNDMQEKVQLDRAKGDRQNNSQNNKQAHNKQGRGNNIGQNIGHDARHNIRHDTRKNAQGDLEILRSIYHTHEQSDKQFAEENLDYAQSIHAEHGQEAAISPQAIQREAQQYTQNWIYKTTVFDTYLIYQNTQEQSLLLLDFHATHERILFDQLSKSGSTIKLLVPVPLVLDVEEDVAEHIIAEYLDLNIVIHKEEGAYSLCEIPSNIFIDAARIAEVIMDMLPSTDIDTVLFASKACRSAAKSGDHVDAQGAARVLSQALAMEHPRCPHGRPLWIMLDKVTLDKMIGRIS